MLCTVSKRFKVVINRALALVGTSLCDVSLQLQDGVFEGRRPDVVENRGCKPADRPCQNEIEPPSGDVVGADTTSPLRGSIACSGWGVNRLVLSLRRGSATPAPYPSPFHLHCAAIFSRRDRQLISTGACHPWWSHHNPYRPWEGPDFAVAMFNLSEVGLCAVVLPRVTSTRGYKDCNLSEVQWLSP